MSPHALSTALAHVEVYLDDFIGIVQGGPTERRKIMQHIFHDIKDFLRPKDKDNTAREGPISLKNLRKGDAAWSMQKVVLRWVIDTVKQILTLPDDRKRNLLSLIDTIPPRASRCSRSCWYKLLGTLRSTVPAIAGAAGIFTRLQHALRTAKGLQINLSTPVHAELGRMAISLFQMKKMFSRHCWGYKPEIFDPRNSCNPIRFPALSNTYSNDCRYNPVLCPNKLIYRRQITARRSVLF